MQRNHRLNASLALAAMMISAGGAIAMPSRSKPVTRVIDSRGFMHGFRQVSEADAERIAAAQAKRERKAMKRAARPQGEKK